MTAKEREKYTSLPTLCELTKSITLLRPPKHVPVYHIFTVDDSWLLQERGTKTVKTKITITVMILMIRMTAMRTVM